MPETIVVNITDWEKMLANSNTLDATTDFLGLPRNSKFDEIKKKIEAREQKKFDEGKASATTSLKPPEGFVVNGYKTIEIINGVTVEKNYAKE